MLEFRCGQLLLYSRWALQLPFSLKRLLSGTFVSANVYTKLSGTILDAL
jgi:hypothetical protein